MSLEGAGFPVFARRHKGLRVPEWSFFIAKYFGSGIIIATAFIHVSFEFFPSLYSSSRCLQNRQLLAPANDALTDPCLTGPITDYDWVEGIALMTVIVMFFLELMTMRYGTFGGPDEHDHHHSPAHHHGSSTTNDDVSLDVRKQYGTVDPTPTSHHAPGEDHLGHSREHTDNDDLTPDDFNERGISPESYAAQLTAIFILEFGVIFHSIFIGLTLAVSGDEFKTLYVVLVFHQTFEGLGLGSRLSNVPWPKSKRWTPYFLALAYGVSTPIAIAIGLGVRNSYPPGSQTTLIVNGVFDSISAGILIYTGLVELMAHEFMFSPYMQKAPIRVVLSAFGLMCLGAGKSHRLEFYQRHKLTETGLMALLGKWA